MQTAMSKTEVFYRNAWHGVEDRVFSPKEARSIFGLRSRSAWLETMRCLDWENRSGFTIEDLAKIYPLRLFVTLGRGNPDYSYSAYRLILNQPILYDRAFEGLGVTDLRERIQKFRERLVNG